MSRANTIIILLVALLLFCAPAFGSEPVPKSKQINYQPLPEIKHQFRQQEPRPPQIVSDVFSLLCAAPILLLFVLWLRIRINLRNASVSLWALGFHLGLAGIFGLYTLYWLQLNMFETLKYLTGIGLFTFVCGNRFLRGHHEMKKSL